MLEGYIPVANVPPGPYLPCMNPSYRTACWNGLQPCLITNPAWAWPPSTGEEGVGPWAIPSPRLSRTFYKNFGLVEFMPYSSPFVPITIELRIFEESCQNIVTVNSPPKTHVLTQPVTAEVVKHGIET